jgi:GT2 family glycosyltransferase
LDDSYGLVYSDVFIIDDNSVKKEKTLYQRNPFFVPPEGDVYHAQAESQFIKGVTCLYRLEAIKKIGLFDEELFFEDVDTFLRLAEHYKFSYYKTPTALWREHDNNMTKLLTSKNTYLITRFLAYRKHVFKANSKISSALLKKMDKIFLMLYRNKYDFNFDKLYMEHLKINNNLLVFCYNNKIAYRWYLITYETKSFIRKLFKYLFSNYQSLPPNSW